MQDMVAHTLLDRTGLIVVDYHCAARPGDPAFVEHHAGYSISYVRSGSFRYRSRGRSYDLVAAASAETEAPGAIEVLLRA